MTNRRLLVFIAGLALLALSAGKSFGELAVAEGRIVTYSFLDDSRGMHQYTIRLSGYKATFQISPDFAQYFAKDRFQANLRKGDYLALSIPAESASNLISDGIIPVYAVRTKTATYLDQYYTLKAYKNRNVTNRFVSVLLRSLVFLVVAVVGIILVVTVALALRKGPRKAAAAPHKPNNPFNPAALNESAERLKSMAAKGASEHKSVEPTCPFCGAPAKRAPLFNVHTQPHEPGESAAVSGHGMLPDKEVLRCTSCNRIIPEPAPAAPADQAPPPVAVVDSPAPPA